MSSPKFDTALDDLFREALAPIADQEVPPDVWDQVVRTVQLPKSERTFWNILVACIIPARRGYPALWRRFTSWAHSIMAYPPSSTHMTYWGSDGRCHSSPFAGVMFPQILDLRHAS